MRKLITLTSFLFLVLSVNAQELSSEKIISRFEFIAGPSFSNNAGYLSNYDSKAGGSIGVGYYQKLYRSLSVNVRTLHELKGSTTNYPFGTTDGDGNILEVNDKYTTKFGYLTFYLMPTLQMGRNKNIYIGAGAYYSFLRKLSVNRYRTNRETGEFIEETTTFDRNYFDPKHDAGVTFQIGYSFKVADKCQIMVQAFCNRGLIDLYNSSMGSQRNNTFGLLLSLRIR